MGHRIFVAVLLPEEIREELERSWTQRANQALEQKMVEVT